MGMDEGVFEIYSTSVDTHLGGADFDQRVMEYFIQLIKKKHNKDISQDNRAILKLKREVEIAKIRLSSSMTTEIEIKDLIEGLNFREELTRNKYEELNSDLFQKTLSLVQTALEDSNLQKSEIDEIILVGGDSTRIPYIRKLVEEFFAKEANTNINIDEAVAYGAAIQGGIICGQMFINVLGWYEYSYLSLGIETPGGFMSKIISRNSILPIKKSKVFTTHLDNQQLMTIKIFEGERPMTKDNHLLGQFNLTGIPAAPRGKIQIEVTFEISLRDIIKVTAVEKSTRVQNQITILNDDDRLPYFEIDNLLEDAQKFEAEDKIFQEMINAKDDLDSYIHSIRNTIEDESKLGNEINQSDKIIIKYSLKEAQDWLIDNPQANKEEYEEKKIKLENTCNPIIVRFTNKQMEVQKFLIRKESMIFDKNYQKQIL